MKQTLLLFLLSFITLSLTAQMTFDPEEVVRSFDPATEFDIENHLDITNANTEDVEFIWTVKQNSGPSEWRVYICDLNKCYQPDKLSIDVDAANLLEKETTKALFFHLMPGSTPGEGTYTFTLFNAANTSEVLTSIDLTFSAVVSSTYEENLEKIYLYPNPVSDYVQINNPSDIASQVVIYDVLGKKIKTFDASYETSFYTGDLQTGRYFARIFDKKGQSLKVVRLVKK